VNTQLYAVCCVAKGVEFEPVPAAPPLPEDLPLLFDFGLLSLSLPLSFAALFFACLSLANSRGDFFLGGAAAPFLTSSSSEKLWKPSLEALFLLCRTQSARLRLYMSIFQFFQTAAAR
jgi:hypothetical protein